MKAIRVHQFGGPEVLRLEEQPRPTPGPGEVLVKIKAIGVNPVDTYWVAGANPAVSLPFTPGLDAAGVVEAAGEAADAWQPGTRVVVAGSLTGTYAEWTVAKASRLHPLPDRTSFAEGASLPIPYGTAHRALFHRAQAKAGETVLIHGASGGVGLAAIQFAKIAGLTIIGTAGTAAGRQLVQDQGAHHVLDHADPDYLQQIHSLTHGRGVDLILEMLANINLGKDLPLLARGGRVIVIGNRGKVEINARDLMIREADVRGMLLFNVPDDELRAVHREIFSGLEKGTLRPIIGKELPLSEAALAQKSVMQSGARGKIILVP
jgi:NADPH2:quinone reductase